MHLTIDGYGGNPELLNNESLVRELLDRYPGEISMTKIAAPYVVQYDGGDKPEDCGVTGFVIIAESHISIHTFDDGNLISIDVFSCKPFDSGAVTEYLNAKIRMRRSGWRRLSSRRPIMSSPPPSSRRRRRGALLWKFLRTSMRR